MPARITVRCLCGKVQQEAATKSAGLPAEVALCHCDDCRYTTGMVAASWVQLDSKVSDLSNLVGYKVSDAATRYFCRQCGSYCFVHTREDDGWHAASGLVEPAEDDSANGKSDIIKVTEHDYVDDTGDGGIVGHLTRIGGRDIPCYSSEPAKGAQPMKQPPEPPMSDKPTSAASSTEDRLRVTCHCAGVDFFLLRPKKRGYKREDYWLKGEDTKYVAKFCVCESCRRAAGFPLQPWTYAPRSELVAQDGSPFDFTSGTLQAYESSHGVFRHFCKRCGATVFFRTDGRAEDLGFDLIDISIGLLRGEGVRAENWLEWHFANISHRDEAVDRELVDAIASGPQR